ncbi:MAG: MFS transporter, partial [Gammaproteobacteria bacterium]|nr:MFS transporter [Gammaproteobacteria bacterium]
MSAMPGSGVSAAAVDAPGAAVARGTHPYYVLALLFLAYTFSFVDRQILSILFEPIKAEMELSDTQLGFLGGLAFALFYSTLGVPIAMLADRSMRTRIITVSLVVFSAMTALCGLAQNFWHLALARVGVGVGEAGVNPASHSIIADIFPPAKRSTAMGLIAVGPNAGMLIGLAAGGILSVQYGWRVTIMAVGLPGLLLALIFWLTVREPRRGGSESRSADVAAPPVRESVVYMWRNRAMRHLVIGAMMKGIGGYGLVSWMPSFLIRTHDLSAAQVGLLLGVGLGVIGGLGAFLGGYLNDRLSKRRAGAGLAVIAVITAAGCTLSGGAYRGP